ncbi:unnamed protein product [Rhizoctonia solani]|uniref:Long chronological lifespan protein 2 n=1 Tax=Rhizoctonia solani TaxID=456999 RepID=A0A8H3CP51_9AGAM|nr:unnamed protein product [Rhizoctonia solani]
MLYIYLLFAIFPAVLAQFGGGGGFFDNFFGGHGGHQQRQQQRAGSGSLWSQQADAIPCSQYLCPDTLVCVSSPTLCPCPAPEDIKCLIPDSEGGTSVGTVVCVRGSSGCEQLRSLASP